MAQLPWWISSGKENSGFKIGAPAQAGSAKIAVLATPLSQSPEDTGRPQQ